MIRSMTGFGKASGDFKGKIISVEIKSLNSKFLELGLRLPSAYREKDIELRSELSKAAERGKIDFAITIEYGPGANINSINREVVKSYYNDLKNLVEDMQVKNADILNSIMHLPLVLNADKGMADEDEWKYIHSLLSLALKSFNEYRNAEGKSLEKDLLERIGFIENLLLQIETFEKERMGNVRTKLLKNLETLGDQINIDKNRFEQELIYYLEKFDITEEKVRLRSHCNYFKQTMSLNENSGKKLGFITQEIGREINTIGSKANDADMQQLVVEMKDETEKLKEQLANVL
jgi:uncharacterized protein (TIGR00255 family)